jgi:hypothetical protein
MIARREGPGAATGRYPSKCDCFRIGDDSFLVEKAQFRQGSSRVIPGRGLVTLDRYRLGDTLAVCAVGDALAGGAGSGVYIS